TFHYPSLASPHLHSFPTRRSSDLKVLSVYSDNGLAECHSEVDVVQVRCTWQGGDVRGRHDKRADGREDDLVGENRGGPRRGRLVICPSGRILASGVNDQVCGLQLQLVTRAATVLAVGQIREAVACGKVSLLAVHAHRSDQQFVGLRSGCRCCSRACRCCYARTRRSAVPRAGVAEILRRWRHDAIKVEGCRRHVDSGSSGASWRGCARTNGNRATG